jgi:hypothetical protein
MVALATSLEDRMPDIPRLTEMRDIPCLTVWLKCLGVPECLDRFTACPRTCVLPWLPCPLWLCAATVSGGVNKRANNTPLVAATISLLIVPALR